MRRRDERGTALMIALILISVFAVVVPALLGITMTGAKVTAAVAQDRQQAYVVSSALEAAIQHGRTARWVGRVGLACPTMNLTIDGETVAVSCSSTTGPFDLDRSLRYEVEMGGTTVAAADVVFRDGTAGLGEPAVDVVNWTPY